MTTSGRRSSRLAQPDTTPRHAPTMQITPHIDHFSRFVRNRSRRDWLIAAAVGAVVLLVLLLAFGGSGPTTVERGDGSNASATVDPKALPDGAKILPGAIVATEAAPAGPAIVTTGGIQPLNVIGGGGAGGGDLQSPSIEAEDEMNAGIPDESPVDDQAWAPPAVSDSVEHTGAILEVNADRFIRCVKTKWDAGQDNRDCVVLLSDGVHTTGSFDATGHRVTLELVSADGHHLAYVLANGATCRTLDGKDGCDAWGMPASMDR